MAGVLRKLSFAVAGIALSLGAVWLAWPGPVPVDVAEASVGPLEVTVSEEAKTRVRHVYAVSSPVTGTVLRISHPSDASGTSSLHVGDAVVAGETVVAVMRPAVPSLLDVRSREELQSALAAADAGVRLAQAEVLRIEAALNFAKTELSRADALARTDAISQRNLDKAKFEVSASEAALSSARAQLDVRRNELGLAQARLMDPGKQLDSAEMGCCVQVRSPVSGRVLGIIQESEVTVQTGVPILEIGDTRDLEVVADLLTTDAVQVSVGAEVRISGWGGNPLRGRVTKLEPAGFTKVSALGIEEQRVRTVIEIVDPPEFWARLGHDFRVFVDVVTWRSDKALFVPSGALFRTGPDWAVFTIRDGRARRTIVQVGKRSSRFTEITEGLVARDLVVLHPSDRIKDGTRAARRAD